MRVKCGTWIARPALPVAAVAILTAGVAGAGTVVRVSHAPTAQVVHLQPSADAYVNEDFPNTNYGASPWLVVARTTEFLTLRRAFIRFDVTAVPAGATVISATLSVYQSSSSGPPVAVGVRPITQTWSAGALTWANQPPGGAVVATTPLASRIGWHRWSVTDLVQDWVDGDVLNRGVQLRGPEASSVEWSHTLDSMEAGHPPALDVEYEVPPTPTTTPTTALCNDAHEPNDTIVQASALPPAAEETGCLPTPGDLDFFQFTAPTYSAVRVELFDLPANFDLQLLSASGQVLDSSANMGITPEAVEHVTGAASELLYARVSSGGGWDLFRPYRIKLTLAPEVPTASPTPDGSSTATLAATATETASAVPTDVASPTATAGEVATSTTTGTPPPPARSPTATDTSTVVPTATTTPEWSSLGGRVWEDADRDRRQDRGEDGIDRVELELVREGVVIGRAVTDADGYYVFATVAGGDLYRVDVDEATVPQPLLLTTCCDPLIVMVRDDQDLRGADFGYAMPPTPTPRPTAAVVMPNVDFAIEGIEVTQATQCFGDAPDLDSCENGDNSLPLVADKATVARVYVTLTHIGPGLPTTSRGWDADVSLLGWDAGTGEMLPGSPLQAEIALVNRDVPLSNVRDYASRSANFALPDEWTSSNPSGIDLMAVLEDRVDECPDCGGNNRTTERGLVFVAQPELHIVPVRIRATRGITRAISSEDASDTLFTKLMKLYPVNEENVIVHSEDDRVLRTEANLGTNDGLGELLDEIADRFVCYQDDFWACGWREGHYFGVISTTVQMGPASPDDPLGRWSGMARRNDCVALGREGRTNTAAHEIGHNLGRMHASNDHGEDDGGDWEEWPYPHGGIGTVGFDTSADRARRLARADAVHWHDLMSYGSGLGSWISPHTYLALHQNLDFCAGFPPGSVAQGAQRSSAQPPTPQHYWLVTGQLDPPELRTVQRVSARLVPAEEPGSSPYAIELQDESGAPLTHRAFEPVHEHVGQAESTHRFRQYLPDTPGVVRVVLFEGQSELASRNASTHAPEVTVTMPDASARWPAAGTARVRWVADDADGDELTYIVMYSRDGGALWVNLATGVRTTEYDVDLGDLGGSDGRAVVRVQATDGFNSGFGESAAFTVVGKGPKARIVLPEPGDLPIPEGYPLRLLAQAYDREDGQLAGRRLAWMSGSASEGGRLLGTGRSLVLDNLPAGRHVVRLRVTDANRGVAEDTRVVYVGHVVWMPAVSRGDVRP